MTTQPFEPHTIHDLSEMRAVISTMLAVAKADNGGEMVHSDTTLLDAPLTLQLVREVLSDGSHVYNVRVTA